MSAGGFPIELSVIVPCYNEEANLPELVTRTERVFARRGIAGEIVLVDDGSRDGTAAQIAALAARHPCVVGVHHPTNRGIPAGWRSGFERSRGRYVCTIDADLQYQPEAIALLYREMCFSRADLVQGWRSSLERQHDHRYYWSRGLDHLLKLAFAMQEYDVKSGFVLYRREVFEDLLQEAGRFHYFQHMITVVAKAKGYSIRQVETLFAERHAGTSFIGGFPLKMMTRTFVDIGRAFAAYRLRELKDQSLEAALPAAAARAADAAPPAGASRNAALYLGELRRTQGLPREALERLQLWRLRRLVAHAADHVGYWRELFQATGLVADEVRTLDDLRRVPILEKAAVRDNVYFDLLSDSSNKRKIRKLATSGATGEPLAVFVDRLSWDMRWANAARHREWGGWRPGDAWLRVVHPVAAGEPPSPLERLRRATAAREPVAATAVVDRAFVDALEERVRRERPVVLEADAEVLALVAAARRGGGEPWARTIVATGQTLDPGVRAVVEARLGARVLGRYGAREVGPVAQQCEHGRWHVNAETFVVEVWCDGRPAAEGERGEILVTDLANRAMPLLRYRLGDRATATMRPCECGRGLPALDAVSGRRPASLLAGPDRPVPASVVADLLADYDYAIQRWQLVQDDPGALALRIVRRSRFTPATELAIRRAVAAAVGDGVRIDLEWAERLPDEPPVVSRLASDVAPAP